MWGSAAVCVEVEATFKPSTASARRRRWRSIIVDDERSDTVLWLKRNYRSCSEADNRTTPTTSLTCTVTQALGEWAGARSRLHRDPAGVRIFPHEPAGTHQPARPDAKPLIFNKLLDRSALADCGRSIGRKSGSPRRLAVPPRCKSSVLVDIYRRIGTFQPALTCAVAVFVDVARHDSS